ncbi:MAG: alpha/beta hydrolase [Bacillus sp. (in: firmicutes)]
MHGFTGSPFELEPLSQYLNKHTDWRISVPTLPGHGDGHNLRECRYSDWISCAEQELRALLDGCEKVYVVGFSMGGVIAAYLTANYPVEKLVLLSAAAKYINIRQLIVDIGSYILDSARGNTAKREFYDLYRTKFTTTPIVATRQFTSLVSRNRSMFKKINVPVFIAQGKADGIVPPASAIYLYKQIPSRHKMLYLMEGAKHLICHEEYNDDMFKGILSFLKAPDQTRVG